MESFMQVGQGPNEGCSAKGKKKKSWTTENNVIGYERARS
jgi:hypothetical protein